MKTINALLLCVGLSNAVNAQVEIREYTGSGGTQIGNDISGSTFNYIATEGMNNVHFAIKNVSGMDAGLRIRRLRIDVPENWSDGMTWGQDPDTELQGSCFHGQIMSSNPWTTPDLPGQPGQAQMIFNGNIGDLNIEIDANAVGVGHYRYYVVSNSGDILIDSIDLNISLPLNVIEQKGELDIVTYPNPASTNLTVTSTGTNENGTLRITDVLGKVVYNEIVTPINKVDVSEYNNGLYLVSICREDEPIITRRVVIKH